MPPATSEHRLDTPALLTLANARLARRPAGARRPTTKDLLADFTAAQQLLGPLHLKAPFTPDQMSDLTGLADEVHGFAQAIVDGQRPPAPSKLNQLASQTRATRTVSIDRDGAVIAPLTWQADTAVAELAADIVAELARMQLSRLKLCAREACPLLFYDTTRSGTRQWHDESPCGLRERQARFRATKTSSTDDDS